MIVQIAANAVKAKLIKPDKEIRQLVSGYLSYRVEGAEYSSQYKDGFWTGYSSLYDMRSDTFPAGFVFYLKTLLGRKGHAVQIVRKPLPEPLGPENPIVDSFKPDPRYDYQMETVRHLIDKGRMIAQIATGGGKSRIARLAYRRINRMTLFLTTRGVLMYQMKDAFEAMGEKVGVIGDGHLKPCRGFNVGMVQTFMAMLKDPKRAELTKKLLEKFEFVILEEAHEAGGNGYYEILNLCKNAHYRLALTATPFMRQDGEDNMRLHGVAGGIGVKVTEKQLIDCGILARPYFKIIGVERSAHLYRTTSWKRAYKFGIVESGPRNQAIVREARRAADYRLKTIVLIQHKAHGELLKKLMTEQGIRCRFVYGDHSQDERKRAISKLAKGEIDVLIGSTIMDVGVDVPAVGVVILAGAGKAEVALRQRIGRGLREKKNGLPNIAFIIDFSDEHNTHLRDHALTRRAIIDQTPGFKEGILREGQDFNFSHYKKAT